MGNQGKIERNLMVCVEVQNNESIHDMQFCAFLFSKTGDMRSKEGQNKVGENGYLELLNKVSVIHFL